MIVNPPTEWRDVPAAVRAALEQPLLKRADGLSGVSQAADVLGWRAGDINAFWGGPRPVTNLIIGAALGSLGGYGAGRLAEEIVPAKYLNQKGLRRRGAIVGGLLGAAPAVWQGYSNIRNTDDVSSVFDRWPTPVKEAAAEELFAPMIPRDQFVPAIFRDPFTPPQLQAATAGLVEAAGAVQGSPFVSPWSVARVAAGAGAGLVSGVVAGKALGLLAGLSPEGQQAVQRTGMWAGLLKQVVPPALGLRL